MPTDIPYNTTVNAADPALAAEEPPPVEQLQRLATGLIGHSGFAGVVDSLRAGHGATIGGTWGAACSLAVAGLAAARPQGGQGPFIVVMPHATEAELLADDLGLFSPLSVELLPPIESFIDPALDGLDIHEKSRPEAFSTLATPENTKGFRGCRSPHPAAADADPAEAARLAVVKRLTGPAELAPRIIVTSMQAVLAPVPDPRQILASTRKLAVGEQLDPQELADWLISRGWQQVDALADPGCFARRGGIIDLFATDWERPIRLELDDDEIESLRTFDTVSQRSIAPIEAIDLTALSVSGGRRSWLTDILPRDSWWGLVEPTELVEEAKRLLSRLPEGATLTSEELLARIYRYPSVTLSAIAPASLEATAQLAVESVERFTGQLDRVCQELDSVGRDQDVWVIAPTEAEQRRLAELLGGSAPARTGRLHFAQGRLSAGFRLLPEKLVLISASELFRRHETATNRLPKHRLSRAIDTFLDLHEGDLVVHVAHGIARYRGLKLLQKQGRTEEFLELEFAESTRIYVPASAIELVQKYVGGGKTAPKLAKIGGTLWARQKRAVEKAVADMAADMLQIQAVRADRPGRAYPPDTPWQIAFEQSFQFDPTPDQATAIEAIRADLEEPKPMDRLLCGDVGFGKTELAMRAAFKAAEAGSQVAVLVPTTILAEQHRRTFCERFAEYPFTIRGLSRLTPTREVRETLEGLARGAVDIVIGTHRLAQADIHFANLGLLVVDEEQRFGVDVKERLKALRASVDVLTMTATPIPRTLHMAMLGIRDISNLTTPPANRLAVETRVGRFDETLIRHAIDRELARDGQVFFVHNRIHDIDKVADRIRAIVPDIPIGIAHGRLSETELETVMLDFVAGRTRLLLATTIIESGLDIPRANTIFIDEADQYGLADLHQLRGRVGRSHHRAYCYLLVKESGRLTETAARRLRAIQEFSSTGAGFSLAMRDLEIRGAGNLLGTQQSGHIATVGYELYCRLLENAVRGLKDLPPSEPPAVAIDLPGDAWLPRDYITDLRTKIDIYRRISRACSQPQVEQLATELADRFGDLPAAAVRLLELTRLRIAAAELGIDSISKQPDMLVLGHHDIRRIERWRKACQLAGRELRIVGNKTAVLPLSEREAADPDRLLTLLGSLMPGGRPAGPARKSKRR